MTSWHDLLDAISGVPALPGARCRGRHHLFDPRGDNEPVETAEQRHALAVDLCAGCPALPACKTWCDSLSPTRRPPGVTAGRLNEPRPAGRPKKKAS